MIYYVSNTRVTGLNTCNPSFVLEWLKDKETVAHDSETKGLDYFSKDNDYVLLWQLGDDKDQFVINVKDYGIGWLKDHFLSDCRKVFHHRAFDINVLLRFLDIEPNRFYCTEIMSRVIYCGLGLKHSMKECAVRELGIEVDKEQRLTFRGHEGDFTIDQLIYAAKDIEITYKLFEALKPKMIDKQLVKAYLLDLELNDWLITRNGMPFDEEEWLKLYEINKVKHLEIKTSLDLFIKKNFPNVYKPLAIPDNMYDTDSCTRYLGSPVNGETYFNWDSATQITNYIFHKLSINPKDKDGKSSVGKDAIEMYLLKQEDGIVKDFLYLYLKYCKSKNAITTFGKDYLFQEGKTHEEITYVTDLFGNKIEHKTTWKEPPKPTVNPNTNRIHCYINPVLNTGRLAMSGPNLSQVPAKDSFRSCFKCKEGYLISAGDFKGQEDIIMAVMSQDHNKVDFIINGHGDTHSYTAEKMFSAKAGKLVEVPPKIEERSLDPEGYDKWIASPNKHLRQIGKILNLMLAFGASANALAGKLGISIKEAEEQYKLYWDGLPVLHKFFKEAQQFALKYGYVQFNDITQRKRYFPEWDSYKELEDKKKYYLDKGLSYKEISITEPKLMSELGKLKGKIERAAGNSRIQGTASDMTKTAIKNVTNELLRYNKLHNTDAKLVLSVHDELECEYRAEDQKAVEAIHKKGMEDAFKLFCWDKGVANIPINVFIQSKPHWFK